MKDSCLDRVLNVGEFSDEIFLGKSQMRNIHNSRYRMLADIVITTLNPIGSPANRRRSASRKCDQPAWTSLTRMLRLIVVKDEWWCEGTLIT